MQSSDRTDSCEGHYEDTLRGGAYLNDPELVRVLVDEAPDRMADLIRWGAVFDVDDCACVAQRPFGGQRFPRTCYAGDRTGHEMMTTLIDRLADTKVETVIRRSRLFHSLNTRGRVSGAMGLDRNGEVMLFRSDSTVIATGGGTRCL